MNITTAQHDALREIMNIAIGRSARLLGELVNKLILLEVPTILIIAPSKIDEFLASNAETARTLIISQEFTGSVLGRVGISFSFDSAGTLLGIISERQPVESQIFSIEELSILEEVANILLNGAISAIADLLDEIIQLSLPTVTMGNPGKSYSKWISGCLDPNDSAFIIVSANMIVEDQSIEGVITFSMAVMQIEELLNKLG